MSVFFNGQLLISPVTASVVNDDAMRNQNLSVGNAAAILGHSAGGKPKTGMTFGSPQEAMRTLVSGELLDAVLAAFDPSRETNGPSKVIALRVNPAVQATGVLKDAQGANVIALTSAGYGAGENDIRVKIEPGTLSGLRPTVQKGAGFYTIDNLGRKAFSLRYTGTEATATASVGATSVVLSAPAGTVVATIDLNIYKTIQSAVDRINQVPGFVAVVGDSNFSKPALSGLDFLVAQDVKTATVMIKADLQAVIDWLNGARQDFVRAERVAGAGKPPAQVGFTFLAGGSDGVTTATDWADAFEALQSIDVQWVGVASPEGSIHAMADAHCGYMSNVARKERRAVVGMDTGTTDLAAVAAAKSLNSDRTSLVHIGHYNYDTTGVMRLFPAYITAAMIAGAFAGVNPGTPLTNKSIKVQGLERELRNPTDTDVLINGGVLCTESTSNGFKVVKSISTWLVNDNYNRVEQSCGVALDFVNRNVREALDVLRGAKGSQITIARAASIAQSTLALLAQAEPSGPGVLSGSKDNPAYRNIRATLVGDVVAVEFECSPVIPVNYILVTIYAVPFSGVATAALGG